MPAAEEHLLPAPHGVDRVTGERSAVVVGGGIAGVAAATVLAERGVRVTLLEKEAFLGGRAGAWPESLPEVGCYQMERGFHAFFRQYYNLRALLRRIDRRLSFLVPLEDYPVLGPEGEMQSFAGLPTSTPANLVQLVASSPAMGLGDLLRVNKRQAMEMLAFDGEATYAKHDQTTAAEYLDSLRFPPKARRLFFDVFAHSFFNPEAEMSAAELLMMFHFYFTGNPEGLIFDVARAPFSTAIWKPFEAYLGGLGVDLKTECAATHVVRDASGRWTVHSSQGAFEGDGVVLALPVGPLKQVVNDSPDLYEPAWQRSIASLDVTRPFVVWRLWLDRPTDPGRAPFVGTTGLGALDNISLYHLFEDESYAWHAEHGGAVVELHAYAVEPERSESELREELLTGLHALYPETRGANVVAERYLVRQDCPAFECGSWAERPGVETPFDGVTVAGDLVRLPFPSALMERAAASGFLAANHLLAAAGVRPEPIRSVRTRGLLARMMT